MRELLDRYAALPGHFDEIHEPSGPLRTHWQAFADRADSMDAAGLDAAQRRLTNQLDDNGVTYNVQAAGTPARAWSLDVLPHIVTADEWTRLDAGLQQRARLLEAIVQDLYGGQRLLTSGTIPPAVVFGHPGFMRAAHDVRPAGGIRLHVLGFDLGRGPDGEWRVLAARAQAPSGAGYALENRLTVSRLFPDAFRDQRVQLLAPFFRTVQETLLSHSPHGGESPHIVLLTPGRYTETYFEHAYLSRYLGFTLVEGADLTVRDDRVHLKTVGGLRPVHAILRRLDDDFCDPLELRANSALGVPGLVDAWRKGSVLIANSFGAGLLESPAMNAFLPQACQEILGEPLQLASPATWWCGDQEGMAIAERRLHELVVRPLAEPWDRVVVADLSEPEQHTWLERIRSRPQGFVVEEHVPLAHVPVWSDLGFSSRALMLRSFAVADGAGGYRVMPGGLSRIGGSDHEVVSGQRGGGSKDTWVLSDAPVERFSLLPGRLRAPDIVRGERPVSSRAAEHLFWLGRYAERSENAARLLRAVLARLPQGDASVSPESAPVTETCRRLELVPASWSAGAATPHEYERTLMAGITDAVGVTSVAFNVEQTLRAAGTVRDRLSSDNWRILNQLSGTLRARRIDQLADALELLDHVIVSLVAVGGLEMAHMTRDDGWRFLSVGRHLERVLYVITTTGEVARSGASEDPALLEWLLDGSDSIITYRARYMGHAEWVAVADLLLFDRTNPRSAAFQLAKLAKHIPGLPGGELGDIGARLDRLAAPRHVLTEESAIMEYLATAEQLALHASDMLTLRYFSHVYEPAHATLI